MKKFVFAVAVLFSVSIFSQESKITKNMNTTIFNYIDGNLDLGNFDGGTLPGDSSNGIPSPVIIPLNFSFHMPVISEKGIFLHFKAGVLTSFYSEVSPPTPNISSTALSFSPGLGYKIETENFVPYASVTYGFSYVSIQEEDWNTNEITKTTSSGSGGEFNIGTYYFFKKWGSFGLHGNASFGFEGGSAFNLGLAYRFTSKKNREKYNLD